MLRTLKRSLIPVWATTGLTILVVSPASGQASGVDSLPVYGAADLHIDASGLRPHRLVYDPLGAAVGTVSAFADGVYKHPQISITLDRTYYYDAGGRARSAIRLRWAANAHPHTDELVVDATTLATVNERTRQGRNWETRDEIVYVRGDTARILTTSDDADPTLVTFSLPRSEYYGTMVLPYLFATMDVPVGSRFRLPTIGSNRPGFIEVDVRGPAQFINHVGDTVTAQLVTSRYSWGSIDWYVSGSVLPYHLHAVWHFGDSNAPTSISQVVSWVKFNADVYSGVIDTTALRRKIGR